MVWRPDDHQAGRWGLKFVFEEYDQRLVVSDEKMTIPLLEPVQTDEWYKRHFTRDSLPRTMIDNVQHAAKVSAGFVGAAAVGALALVGATIIVAASVALSIGLVALGWQVKMFPPCGNCLKPFLLHDYRKFCDCWAGGRSWNGKKRHDIYTEAQDESEYYLFARFLPSMFYARAVNLLGKEPVIIQIKKRYQPFFTSAIG